MSANTSPDNITYPVSTDAVSPLETVFSAMATSVQAAFTNRFAVKQSNTYKWANVTARNAQTGMTEGDYGDQADIDMSFRYNGSAWKMMSSGLVPIIPTSVVNATVTAGGIVTPSAGVASFSLNGVFSSDYTSYLLRWETLAGSASSALLFRLRVAGADESTATNYSYQLLQGSASSAVSAGTSSNRGSLMDATTLASFGEARIDRPAVVDNSHILSSSHGVLSSTTMVIMTVSNRHNVAAAYDGITLLTSTGTFNASGSVTVFGYNH